MLRKAITMMRSAVPLSCMLLVLCLHPNQLSAQNIVWNSDFEGGLASWSVSTGTATYTVDSTVHHGGAFAVRGIETDSNSLGRLYQNVTSTIIPGREYVLSGWLKTQGVTGGGFVIGLDYVGLDGATPAGGGVMTIGGVLGTQDWSFFESGPFVIPPMPRDAAALCVLMDFNASAGIAWVDDLQLTVVSTLDIRVPRVGRRASGTRSHAGRLCSTRPGSF
jgi:hypothetical protein